MIRNGDVWFRRFVLIVAILLAIATPLSLVFNEHSFDKFLAPAYLLLLILSMVLSWLSIKVYMNFINDINSLKNRGLQVQSMPGYHNLNRNIVVSTFKTLIILADVLVATALFFIITDSIVKISSVILTIALIAALASSVGLIFLIPIPKLKFAPGALSKYYSSPKVPLRLKYFLSDTVTSTMDPASRLRFDEWAKLLEDNMRNDFAKGLSKTIRIERAKASVLLLTYLKHIIPEKGERIFETKIKSIIKESALKKVRSGADSQISFEILEELVKNSVRDRPGAFKIIDRLMNNLIENFEEMKKKDLWVETYTPSSVNSYKKQLATIVFIINLSQKFKEKQRNVELFIDKEGSMLEDFPVRLDPFTTTFDNYQNVLINAKEGKRDAIDLAIDLLQIGEGFQFQTVPHTWGNHVINIGIKEGDETAWGESISYNAWRDYTYLAGGAVTKIAAIGGALISALGIGLSGVLSIFGL